MANKFTEDEMRTLSDAEIRKLSLEIDAHINQPRSRTPLPYYISESDRCKSTPPNAANLALPPLVRTTRMSARTQARHLNTTTDTSNQSYHLFYSPTNSSFQTDVNYPSYSRVLNSDGSFYEHPYPSHDNEIDLPFTIQTRLRRYIPSLNVFKQELQDILVDVQNIQSRILALHEKFDRAINIQGFKR